jgi:hypothetical protein
MTRDKMKQMVERILEESVHTHVVTKAGIEDMAEEIMKLWDQGFTYETSWDERRPVHDSWGQVVGWTP